MHANEQAIKQANDKNPGLKGVALGLHASVLDLGAQVDHLKGELVAERAISGTLAAELVEARTKINELRTSTTAKQCWHKNVVRAADLGPGRIKCTDCGRVGVADNL